MSFQRQMRPDFISQYLLLTKASISPFYKIQIPFCRFTIFRVFPFSIQNSANRPKFTVFLNKKSKIWKYREFLAMF